MSPEPAVVDEAARLAALQGLALSDTLAEPVFDAITAAAAQACGVPTSLVSLVDAERQWFKSQRGLPGATGTPCDAPFCDHTIRGDALFEVGDATRDPRFAANPLVTGDPNIRFYAGAPIVLPGGERIGTVCVIDRVPRELDDAQRGTLTNLALIASAAVVDRIAKMRLAAELDDTLARLSAVVDNVPAMLCHCDARGIVRFVNREFQAAAGLPIDQIVGRPLSEVQRAVDPTGFGRLEPRLADVMQGRRQEFEVGLLTAAGLRQFRTTLVPEASRPGRPSGFCWMALDITGRKALELRLADSEQRYRSLFDYLNSGFALHEIVVDHGGRPVDYRFVAMNSAFTAMSGLDALSSLGRCVTELLPGIEHDPADWIGVYGRVAQTGEAVHLEQHARVLDRWFEVVAYRPAPGQFAVIAQDITERKSATERLALSEQRLRLLVDAVHDHSMILLDVQGLVETWNVGAQRVHGHAADEIVGQHYRRFFDEAEKLRGDPEDQLAVASAYGRFANEGWRVRRDGSRFWAAVTLSAVRDPAGRLHGFLKVTRDLSPALSSAEHADGGAASTKR